MTGEDRKKGRKEEGNDGGGESRKTRVGQVGDTVACYCS